MTDQIRDLTVEQAAIGELVLHASNPRTHTKRQVRQIADSIRTFGWTNPVLVDADGGVIAGHGRLEAARLLGRDQVPVIRLADLTPAQKRAYVIADNRLAELAGWDDDLLAVELQGLAEMDLGFALEVTGFETAEIDLRIAALGDERPDAADEVPPPDPDLPAVCDPGDLWLCGRHRLLCADATMAESYARLLAGETAQMIFTDPPYNVPIAGHVSGLGKKTHDEFAMASGEMSEAEFIAFLETVLGHLAASSSDGAIHFVCMDWRHIAELLAAGRRTHTELKNICVWAKSNAGMGSLYRSRHELIAVFKSGRAPHVNNVELGRHGRYRTNVWEYAGANAFGAERDEALAMHPTVKPVQLVEDAILDCSRRGDLVLDPFGGAGTTLVAAERAGRRAALIELDPRYCDTTLRRFHQLTGEMPVHAATGLTLADLGGLPPTPERS